jgi:hypothetical protein
LHAVYVLIVDVPKDFAELEGLVEHFVFAIQLGAGKLPSNDDPQCKGPTYD